MTNTLKTLLLLSIVLVALMPPLIGDDCYLEGPGDDFCVSAEGHVYYFGWRP